MSYATMDHAQWVENNNRAFNQIYARRKSHCHAPEQLTTFQAKVMDILGMFAGGIYNAPISWEKVDWECGRGVAVPYRAQHFSTFDFAGLTRLVFLCHEARIRCEICDHARGYFLLMFHERVHEGSMSLRHPNLDEAVAEFREYLPADHRIIYADDQGVGKRAGQTDNLCRHGNSWNDNCDGCGRIWGHLGMPGA
jgi:hypothetical protein